VPDTTTVRRLRVAAYAIIIDDEKILLTHWVSPFGNHWTLPGGGLEHGEDPYEAVVREVAEETGYHFAVDHLLGIDNYHRRYDRPEGRVIDQHSIRLLYAGRVVGGELRNEVDGSSDEAAWVPLSEVDKLERDTRPDLIDAGLTLARVRPPDGRLR
jgi:8-oxo-dGTP diphosphatase